MNETPVPMACIHSSVEDNHCNGCGAYVGKPSKHPAITGEELSHIKKSVNALLFEVLPGHSTIDEVDSLACDLTEQILTFIAEKQE